MTEVALLTAIAILFVVIGPVVLIGSRAGLSIVPALILAGVIVGQLGIIDEELMLELARLGIAFLVFSFSIQIHTERIRTVVSDAEIVAIGQTLIIGGLGIGFAMAVGVAVEFGVFSGQMVVTIDQALFVGITAALSSTITGTVLFTKSQSDIVHDYLTSEIDAFGDLLAVFILLVVSAGVLALDPIATQLGYGVLLITAAVIVNRYLFGVVERLAGGTTESMLISIVALLILFLGIAEFLETSIVVGAFAAGIAIRDNPVTYSEVFNGLTSIRQFFVGLFFATVGALVTLPVPGAIVADPAGTVEPFLPVIVLALGLVVLTVIIKPIVTAWLLVSSGYDRRSATFTGLDLDHVGEFSVIVAIEALILGLLTEPVFEAIILAAALSMLASSLTQAYEEQIYQAIARRGWLGSPSHTVADWKSVPDGLANHVVIVGYGRQGNRIVEFCEERGQPYVVIENNPQLLPELRADCEAYIFGDAIEAETAAVANVTDAQLVICTTESKNATDHFLSFSDTTDVVVRSRGVPTAATLLERGARYVIVPDLLAADQLADRLDQILRGGHEPGRLHREATREQEPTPRYRSRTANVGSADRSGK